MGGKIYYMESTQAEDKSYLTDEGWLSREILLRVGELLEMDGKEVMLYPNFGPSKIAKYGLDVPKTIGGEGTLPEEALSKNVSTELTLQHSPARGGTTQTMVTVRIFDRKVEELSFTLNLVNGKPPTFQYFKQLGETHSNRFYTREANLEDLGGILEIFENPLYLLNR